MFKRGKNKPLMKDKDEVIKYCNEYLEYGSSRVMLKDYCIPLYKSEVLLIYNDPAMIINGKIGTGHSTMFETDIGIIDGE